MISIQNLSVEFSSKSLFDNVTFVINKRDRIALVGRNGAGKSTMLKIIAGLQSPTSGSVSKPNDITIGYLPQQTLMQKDFPASVGEIVLSGCLASCGMKPFYSAKQKKLAFSSMERLGISGMKNRCYRDLSGGQQQRVLLARALCAASKMLLLDEPVTGLDPAASAEMYNIVSDLNEKEKITIIMVSHDIEAAVKYASHILHLGSEMQFFGTKEEYVKSPVRRYFK